MLVRSYSSQDELNRKVKMCHKGYTIPRNQRNFGGLWAGTSVLHNYFYGIRL